MQWKLSIAIVFSRFRNIFDCYLAPSGYSVMMYSVYPDSITGFSNIEGFFLIGLVVSENRVLPNEQAKKLCNKIS